MDALQQIRGRGPEAGISVTISELDLIKQIKNVLRLGVGNRFILLDGLGTKYEVEIQQFAKKQINCSLVSFLTEECRTLPQIEIVLALIKSDRFEWCLEKLTELGVDLITPLVTQHCVVKHAEKGKEKLRRWESIVRESAEQCERMTIPRIVTPVSFSEYIYRPRSGGTSTMGTQHLEFICAERKQAEPLLKRLDGEGISTRCTSDIKHISLISLMIGPEGGFSEHELNTAETQGWKPVSLGPRILRAETAAIAALSQVASILDMQ
ncbi:MAG: 16S rRNA (uracil(1498)-N(3))-methyltransferase [Candidatus Obscuribacterales bacterium]|jgi:16S rRNA (uracil1498-N3)-methyltransferase|nr:16S rRNA (uracil(1498)-N(3))-methyltransferase [Candidatus Obscuribacterales bacterium]